MKKLLIVFLSLFFSIHSLYAWWTTGHALTAEVAYENINQTTKDKVNYLLNIEPDVPKLNDWKQPPPTPEVLYKTYNFMQGAASWPDDIKNYYWEDFKQKNNYSDLHFVDIDLNLAKQGDLTYCQTTLTKDYINSYLVKNDHNIVYGIESSIKTLTSKATSDNEKATAIRYLIHLMGDIHQPLHTTNPTLSGIDTYGGNRMVFDENNIPEYAQINGQNPFKEFTLLSIPKLHAYFDSALAEYNQLQETTSSKYSPEGYDLWEQYKPEYLAYLQYLALQIGTYPDNQAPKIFNWVKQSSQLACQMLITDASSLNYSLNGQSITVTFDPNQFLSNYSYDINQQLFLGGIRLARILEAIYDTNNHEPNIISYRKVLIDPIKNNPNIPTLSTLMNNA